MHDRDAAPGSRAGAVSNSVGATSEGFSTLSTAVVSKHVRTCVILEGQCRSVDGREHLGRSVRTSSPDLGHRHYLRHSGAEGMLGPKIRSVQDLWLEAA